MRHDELLAEIDRQEEANFRKLQVHYHFIYIPIMFTYFLMVTFDVHLPYYGCDIRLHSFFSEKEVLLVMLLLLERLQNPLIYCQSLSILPVNIQPPIRL